ncbi:hypothetical protein [Streptomyces shenzhenensis]|uniref:hypothetical protein n=1 Tax=Streptomyces shenzhenensis TaxID=943815 RepID=UPI0036A76292
MSNGDVGADVSPQDNGRCRPVGTVDYHGRKGKERLRIRLGLPAAPGKTRKGAGQ